MSVWVVLPTYDEADNVERVVEAVRKVLRRWAPAGFRILVVDDASPDGTGEIADGLASRHPGEVEVLHRAGKDGLGPAYVAGFTHALEHGARYVLEMDADLSHDPADIPRLLVRARAGADVVLGSRYVRGGGTRDWGLGRRVVSRAGGWYARAVLGVRPHDLTGGFKCFRASALRAIDPATLRAHGYAFQIEATYRAVQLGLQVVEVPIVFRDRRAGASKMTAAIAREAAWQVLALRFARPQRRQPESGLNSVVSPGA
jgi:dolichol-phosphate mannosyltransferase